MVIPANYRQQVLKEYTYPCPYFRSFFFFYILFKLYIHDQKYETLSVYVYIPDEKDTSIFSLHISIQRKHWKIDVCMIQKCTGPTVMQQM